MIVFSYPKTIQIKGYVVFIQKTVILLFVKYSFIILIFAITVLVLVNVLVSLKCTT